MMMMFGRIGKTLAVSAALACSMTAAMAQGDIPAPTGKAVLTISGKIANTNVGDTAVFDIDMLKSLPTREFTTGTIWTDKPHKFTGVPIAIILEYVGAQGTNMRATAVNDYAVDIPAENEGGEGPMIAYHLDGEEMSVRDKGPLWVIYDFDADPAHQNEVVYSRSIWQLDRLEVTD